MGRLCEDHMSELAATHKGVLCPRSALHIHPNSSILFPRPRVWSHSSCAKKPRPPCFFFFYAGTTQRLHARFARGSSESKLQSECQHRLRDSLMTTQWESRFERSNAHTQTHTLVLFFSPTPRSSVCLCHAHADFN